MSAGREEFLRMMKKYREARLTENADKYAKLPDNVRAAIARVAGVESKRLDEMTVEERTKLYNAAARLRNQLEAAYGVLVATQWRD